MCLAAMMLYEVEQTSVYLEEAIEAFDSRNIPNHFDWDDKRVACAVSHIMYDHVFNLLFKLQRKT